jgi:hypothetical protein
MHCKHCLGGGCPGDCLIGDTGRCIHGWNVKHPRRFAPRNVFIRGWWHRVFWGPR